MDTQTILVVLGISCVTLITDMLRVCFVTEDYSPNFIGGQGVWGAQLVAHMRARGVQVMVLAEKREKRNAPNIILVPFCFGNQLLLAFFEYVWFVTQLRHTHFDILHANQLTALFFILFRPVNIGRVVVSVHNTWDQMGRFPLLVPLESYIFRHADGLLFHTESEKRYVIKRYKLAHKPTAVVPMGTPQVKHIPAKRPRIMQKPIVLYIGRLVRRKNVDTILRALGKIQSEVSGIIVGDGPDRKRLEEMAPPNVRFMGFVRDTTLYLQRADVFVLPSVAEGGVALAAYEAASFGLPLLLSPDAADPYILKDGENGYIIYPTDGDALAAKVQKTLEQKKRFSAVSRQKARALTWTKTAFGTIAFYRRLLERDANIG